MAKNKSQQRRACGKRPKGAPENVKRQGDKAVSRMPRRCPDPGGPSGKSNNGGKAPTFEVGGMKTSPRPGRRPSRVPTRPIA